MKALIFILLLFVISNPVFCQAKQDTIFFDINWKATSRNNAEFFRIIEKDTVTEKLKVKDYYISGQIQMDGQYISFEQGTKDGIFTYWYRNGNKQAEIEYKEGLFVKNIHWWDENGNEIEVNGHTLDFEVRPEFPGGDEAMIKWVTSEVKYPDIVKENFITGKVFVQFVIDRGGKVTDVKILKGVHPLLDEEAIRVVKTMPDWKPGMSKGVPVKVSFQFPINFKLWPSKKNK